MIIFFIDQTLRRGEFMLMPMLMLPVLDVWPGRRPEGRHFAKGRVYAFLDSRLAHPAPRPTKACLQVRLVIVRRGVLLEGCKASTARLQLRGLLMVRADAWTKKHPPPDIRQGAPARGHPPVGILQGTSSEDIRQRTSSRGHPPGGILQGTSSRVLLQRTSSRGPPPGGTLRGHPPEDIPT